MCKIEDTAVSTTLINYLNKKPANNYDSESPLPVYV